MPEDATHESAPAVAVRGVRKSFPRKLTAKQMVKNPFAKRERVCALRGVDLEVPRGELIGLLGPNGAGKTTLIKVLCGLVLPEEGSAEVLGRPSSSRELPSLLGLVHSDERSFYWRLTGRENLTFFARLYGLRGDSRKTRVDHLLERVRLIDDADRRFSDYSSGMKQRMAIARALLADPPVLLMDEPTRSLDPITAAELRSWIVDELHEQRKKTILIATHNLREAEALCDRVAVLAKGRMRAVATPAELRRRGLGGLHYLIRLQGPEDLAAVRGGTVVSSTSGDDGCRELRIRIDHEHQLDALLRELLSNGRRMLGCSREEEDLEKIFHEIVESGGFDDEVGQEPEESR